MLLISLQYVTCVLFGNHLQICYSDFHLPKFENPFTKKTSNPRILAMACTALRASNAPGSKTPKAAWLLPARVAVASSASCATKMFRRLPAAVTSTTTRLIRRRCAKTPRRKLLPTALTASAAAVVVSSANCAVKMPRASAALGPCELLPASPPRPSFHKRRSPGPSLCPQIGVYDYMAPNNGHLGSNRG